MKKIILDTDIGIDSDDAVALALLIGLANRGECVIPAVTAATTRAGATGCIEAICNYYGFSTRTGRLHSPALECDKTNTYAQAVSREFGCRGTEKDATALLRETLAAGEDKFTLCAIGPLTNIKNLLLSKPDEISPKSGQELFDQRIDEMYIMGGIIHEPGEQRIGRPRAEWNFVQDPASAKYVLENVGCAVWLSTFDAGNRVFSGGHLTEKGNPVFRCLELFKCGNAPEQNGFARESWDPVTCYCAARGVPEYLSLSPAGKITVDQSGATTFVEDKNAKMRYIKLKPGADCAGFAAAINAYVAE